MVQTAHIWNMTPRVSDRWHALDATARMQAVTAALREIPAAAGLAVESVDANGELIISSIVVDERRPGEDGARLMAVEAALRQRLGEPVELYFLQRQDENKPRQNRDVILEWIRSREELRAQGTRERARESEST